MTAEVAINKETLSKAVEKVIRPAFDKGVFSKTSNGEGWQHKVVLPKVSALLARKAIDEDPLGNLKSAIDSNGTLLGWREVAWAKEFLKHCDRETCRERLLDLLYGTTDLLERIQSFVRWSAKREIAGATNPAGFTYAIVSYLLCMVDPKKYAFCKPRNVYRPAVEALLGKQQIPKDPCERIVHATEFYRAALELLVKEHGLPFEDLLHVHAAFWILSPRCGGYGAKWMDLSKKPNGKPKNGGVEISSDEIGSLILLRKNVLLYGPPGTGKTYRSLQLAERWKSSEGKDSVSQVTFHSSYAYEDFIEGFRPGDDGHFGLRDGIFVEVCEKARENQKRHFLLIIDEINRGDVARLFGELITLIESDKRHESAARKLPYSKKDFWVSPNLHILGTMNTADRSISLLDIAIRRRFCFVECRPDSEVISTSNGYLKDVEGVSIPNLLDGINERLLNNGIDRDRAIGHSYLLIPKNAESPLDSLRDRLIYDILPLIEEYCYSDRSLMGKILGKLVDDHGEIDVELMDTDSQFLEELKKLSTAE